MSAIPVLKLLTRFRVSLLPLSPILAALLLGGCVSSNQSQSTAQGATGGGAASDDFSAGNLANGQRIFRFDTFGDEQFWTDTLQMNQVVETAVDPTTALHG